MHRTVVSRRGVLAGGAGLLATTAGCGGRLERRGEQTPTPGTATTAGGPTTTPASDGDDPAVHDRFVEAYREHADSVVSIRVVTTDGTSQGSGFLVDDSHVLTNEHVVGDGGRNFVQYRTGDYEVADLLGTDVLSDLAVLEVTDPPTAARPISLREGIVPVGTEVVALGTPFGLEESMTTGVVSGVDRLLTIPGGVRCPDVIQTDAAVNPGNSGGPLVPLDGGALGVVTATGGQNVSMAVSGRLARRVVPELVSEGAYHHPFVGVELASLSAPVAEANGLETTHGALVLRVFSGGPADGVLRGSRREDRDGQAYPVGGDVVRAVDGTEVRTVSAYARHLALETSPGDAVSLRILRDGEVRTVGVTLGSRDETSW